MPACRRVAAVRIGVAMAMGLVGSVPVRAEPADPHIERARAHMDALAFERAQAELHLALRAGGSDRSRLAVIYRLLGMVQAGLDLPEKAVDSYRHLLALDPGAEIAAEHGPKLVEPFAEAKASLQRRGQLTVQVEPVEPVDRTLIIVVESDPLDMVAEVQASFVTRNGRETLVSGSGQSRRIVFAIPDDSVRARVYALDQHRNRLAEIERDLAMPAPAGALTSTARTEKPALYARWTVWAGASLGLAGVGTAWALAARSTRSELVELEQETTPSFSRVEQLDERGRRRTLWANLAFGAAGAAAATSAALFIWQREAPARVAAMPAQGGGILVVSGLF